MVTYPELYNMDTSKLARSAEACVRLSKTLSGRADEVQEAGRIRPGIWWGSDSFAASGLLLGQVPSLFDASDVFRRSGAVIEDLVTDLESAKRVLNDAVDLTRGTEVSILPDGTIDPPTSDKPDVQRIIDQATRIIKAALDLADAADTEAKGKLEDQYAPPDPNAIPKGPGDTPQEVEDWWNSLSDVQKNGYLKEYPELLSMLDGLPSDVRDKASRIVLDEAIADTKKQIDDYHNGVWSKLDGLDVPLLDTVAPVIGDKPDIEALEEKLANLEGIKALVNDKDHPGRMLLGFDPSGDGKAIIATGNPDHASNVLTHVPGTGADLGNVSGAMDKVDILSGKAGDNTVGILWQGYDAPDNLNNAAVREYADHGAPDLAAFQDGLRVSHEGAPSHNTVLGHSYGTTVVGHALADHDMNADDVVFVGSPGVGVDNVSELGIDPQHVWASRAENDVIGYVPEPGTKIPVHTGIPVGPFNIPGPTINVPVPDEVHIPGTDTTISNHGLNPTDPRFGARVFASSPGDDDWLPGDRSIKAHSQYWEADNPALGTMADIVRGHK